MRILSKARAITQQMLIVTSLTHAWLPGTDIDRIRQSLGNIWSSPARGDYNAEAADKYKWTLQQSAQYGNVNLLTGKPSLSVPLGAISAGSTTFPIEIQYSEWDRQSRTDLNFEGTTPWSPFGQLWTMPIPYVQRELGNLYTELDDQFWCSLGPWGAGELVRISGTASEVKFLLATNPLVEVIAYKQYEAIWSWVFITPDGTILRMGAEDGSYRFIRNSVISASTQAVVDRPQIYRWDISKIGKVGKKEELVFEWESKSFSSVQASSHYIGFSRLNTIRASGVYGDTLGEIRFTYKCLDNTETCETEAYPGYMQFNQLPIYDRKLIKQIDFCAPNNSSIEKVKSINLEYVRVSAAFKRGFLVNFNIRNYSPLGTSIEPGYAFEYNAIATKILSYTTPEGIKTRFEYTSKQIPTSTGKFETTYKSHLNEVMESGFTLLDTWCDAKNCFVVEKSRKSSDRYDPKKVHNLELNSMIRVKIWKSWGSYFHEAPTTDRYQYDLRRDPQTFPFNGNGSDWQFIRGDGWFAVAQTHDDYKEFHLYEGNDGTYEEIPHTEIEDYEEDFLTTGPQGEGTNWTLYSEKNYLVIKKAEFNHVHDQSGTYTKFYTKADEPSELAVLKRNTEGKWRMIHRRLPITGCEISNEGIYYPDGHFPPMRSPNHHCLWYNRDVEISLSPEYFAVKYEWPSYLGVVNVYAFNERGNLVDVSNQLPVIPSAGSGYGPVQEEVEDPVTGIKQIFPASFNSELSFIKAGNKYLQIGIPQRHTGGGILARTALLRWTGANFVLGWITGNVSSSDAISEHSTGLAVHLRNVGDEIKPDLGGIPGNSYREWVDYMAYFPYKADEFAFATEIRSRIQYLKHNQDVFSGWSLAPYWLPVNNPGKEHLWMKYSNAPINPVYPTYEEVNYPLEGWFTEGAPKFDLLVSKGPPNWLSANLEQAPVTLWKFLNTRPNCIQGQSIRICPKTNLEDVITPTNLEGVITSVDFGFTSPNSEIPNLIIGRPYHKVGLFEGFGKIAVATAEGANDVRAENIRVTFYHNVEGSAGAPATRDVVSKVITTHPDEPGKRTEHDYTYGIDERYTFNSNIQSFLSESTFVKSTMYTPSSTKPLKEFSVNHIIDRNDYRRWGNYHTFVGLPRISKERDLINNTELFKDYSYEVLFNDTIYKWPPRFNITKPAGISTEEKDSWGNRKKSVIQYRNFNPMGIAELVQSKIDGQDTIDVQQTVYQEKEYSVEGGHLWKPWVPVANYAYRFESKNVLDSKIQSLYQLTLPLITMSQPGAVILGANKTDWSSIFGQPNSQYIWNSKQPKWTQNTSIIYPPYFSIGDQDFQRAQAYEFDGFGYVSETTAYPDNTNSRKNSTIYGNKFHKPLVVFDNADRNSVIALTGENGSGTESLVDVSEMVRRGISHSGQHSMLLQSGSIDIHTGGFFTSHLAQEMKASVWALPRGTDVPKLKLEVYNYATGVVHVTKTVSAQVSGRKWVNMEAQVQVPEAIFNSERLFLKARATLNGATLPQKGFYFDDLVVCPAKSSFTIFGYDDQGKLISSYSEGSPVDWLKYSELGKRTGESDETGRLFMQRATHNFGENAQ